MKAKDWIAALAGVHHDAEQEQRAIRDAEAAAAEQGGTLLVKPAAPVLAALRAAYPWLMVRQDAGLSVQHAGAVLSPPAFTLCAPSLEELDKLVCASVEAMLGLVEIESAEELKDWFFYLVFDRVSEVSLEGPNDPKSYSASMALVAVFQHQVDCHYSFDPQSASMKLFGSQAEVIAPEELERRVTDKNLSDPAQCTSVLQEIMAILSDTHRKVQQGCIDQARKDIDVAIASLESVKTRLDWIDFARTSEGSSDATV